MLPFDLRDTARIAELVPDIKANSLVSVGKLADAGYTTVFLPLAEGILIVDSKSGDKVLEGWREESRSKLWRLVTKTPSSTTMMGQSKTKVQVHKLMRKHS
jgi:hypothetical protein